MGPDPVPAPHRGVELIIRSVARMAGRQHSKKHSHNTVFRWFRVPKKLSPQWIPVSVDLEDSIIGNREGEKQLVEFAEVKAMREATARCSSSRIMMT